MNVFLELYENDLRHCVVQERVEAEVGLTLTGTVTVILKCDSNFEVDDTVIKN